MELPPLIAQPPESWRRKHLLDLESLSAEELTCILDTAAAFKQATDGCRRKLSVLSGRTLANLFFENSTRTRNSFSLAARRLGADTVEFSSESMAAATCLLWSRNVPRGVESVVFGSPSRSRPVETKVAYTARLPS